MERLEGRTTHHVAASDHDADLGAVRGQARIQLGGDPGSEVTAIDRGPSQEY